MGQFSEKANKTPELCQAMIQAFIQDLIQRNENNKRRYIQDSSGRKFQAEKAASLKQKCPLLDGSQETRMNITEFNKVLQGGTGQDLESLQALVKI